jgi:hypothetical protein
MKMIKRALGVVIIIALIYYVCFAMYSIEHPELPLIQSLRDSGILCVLIIILAAVAVGLCLFLAWLFED